MELRLGKKRAQTPPPRARPLNPHADLYDIPRHLQVSSQGAGRPASSLASWHVLLDTTLRMHWAS